MNRTGIPGAKKKGWWIRGFGEREEVTNLSGLEFELVGPSSNARGGWDKETTIESFGGRKKGEHR